jgi:integrase/recombinase XerD
MLAAACDGRQPLRDLAIIKTMLDTGCRASEICGARRGDLRGELLAVFGKGSKQRRVPLGQSTLASVQMYIETRPAEAPEAPLFMSDRHAPLTRHGLRLLLARLGQRASVADCHPHRMRHTFALNYLMNGGDPYTLQAILGHSTMEMVKRYLRISEGNVLEKHQQAGPVKNWGL